MKTIKLYGHLGDTFGHEFVFDVHTPAEAIKLLCANFKNFSEYLIQHNEPGYKVFVGNDCVSKDDLHNPTSTTEIIKIIPVVQGAGGNGPGQIIVGALLIVASFFVGPWAITAWGAPSAAAAAAASMGGAMASLGWAMVIGGVAQMMFAPPQTESNVERAENKPSYAFDGAVNTIRQGNPVPIGYGELIVGSQVISAGLFAEQLNIQTTSGGGGSLKTGALSTIVGAITQVSG